MTGGTPAAACDVVGLWYCTTSGAVAGFGLFRELELSWLVAAMASSSCASSEMGSRGIILNFSLAYSSKSLLSLSMSASVLTLSKGFNGRLSV